MDSAKDNSGCDTEERHAAWQPNLGTPTSASSPSLPCQGLSHHQAPGNASLSLHDSSTHCYQGSTTQSLLLAQTQRGICYDGHAFDMQNGSNQSRPCGEPIGILQVNFGGDMIDKDGWFCSVVGL